MIKVNTSESSHLFEVETLTLVRVFFCLESEGAYFVGRKIVSKRPAALERERTQIVLPINASGPCHPP